MEKKKKLVSFMRPIRGFCAFKSRQHRSVYVSRHINHPENTEPNQTPTVQQRGISCCSLKVTIRALDSNTSILLPTLASVGRTHHLWVFWGLQVPSPQQPRAERPATGASHIYPEAPVQYSKITRTRDYCPRHNGPSDQGLSGQTVPPRPPHHTRTQSFHTPPPLPLPRRTTPPLQRPGAQKQRKSHRNTDRMNLHTDNSKPSWH